MNRLVVVSNPRSGTSLLIYLLLVGFDLGKGKKVLPIEGNFNDVYSYRREFNDIDFLQDDLKAVVIIRDPRSVVTSRHPSCPDDYLIPSLAWYNNMSSILDYAYCGSLYFVWYEDLLLQPDIVQTKISMFLDLNVVCPFSLCYKKSTAFKKLHRSKDIINEMGGIRFLDFKKTDRWKDKKYLKRIKKEIYSNKDVSNLMDILGYSI